MARKRFEVRWAETASKDLESIVGRIADDSVERALRVFARIRARGAALRAFPRRGRIVPELHERGVLAYREIQCPPWRIFYREERGSVYVVAVIDGRRNVEDILLERFLR